MLQAFADGTIFGETCGDAPYRVLALHGWQRTRADLLPVLQGPPAISGIALDLPGFGASALVEPTVTTAQYAAAIEPVLEVCAPRVLLLGHSFGGRVALRLAQRRPDRVAGLVLCGVPLLPADAPRTRPSRAFAALRLARRLHLVSEARLEASRRRRGSPDYASASPELRRVLVACVGESYDDALRAIDAPIELVWGALDTAAPLWLANRAAGLGHEVRLDVHAELDHFLPLAAPEALRAALTRLQR